MPVRYRWPVRASFRRRSRSFSQPSLDVPKLNADAGADVPEVADVVVEPLHLREQDARQAGRGRDLGAGQAFDRLAERRRVADRADAAGALDDRQGFAEGSAFNQPLDAAMRVEEPGVEMEHRLAHRREAEVAGLDDAGVDRADGQLVDAVAVGHERFDAPRYRAAAGGPDGLRVRRRRRRGPRVRPTERRERRCDRWVGGRVGREIDAQPDDRTVGNPDHFLDRDGGIAGSPAENAAQSGGLSRRLERRAAWRGELRLRAALRRLARARRP